MMKLTAQVKMLLWIGFLGMNAAAQDITFYFPAGDFSGEPDRFGNTHRIIPMEAIDPRPFGNEALQDVYFDEDNLWLIYRVEGNVLLVSHAPGFGEDAPELTMEITVAMGGKYEVILRFLDSNDAPDTGPIQAALGDAPLALYSASNSIRATGGTVPGYPTVGGATSGGMFWYSASLGEVEVEAGGVIKVRVDDTPYEEFNLASEMYVTSTFQGVTLRVIELSGGLSEVQVSPGAQEWTTDLSGNRFRTWPVDEATYATVDSWLTINANSGTDNKWNIRQNLGPYGPILEAYPNGPEDAPALKTSVIFAQAGTYDVYVSIGDTGAATPEDNLANPNPLKVAKERDPLKTWVAGDGEFKGTPGYNDYEIHLGKITVTAGQQVNFLIDDDPDYPNGQRSVYLGMRFVKETQVVLKEFQVSPGVFEMFTDIGGNQYMTWPVDEAAYATMDSWLTVNANSTTDNKWNIRQNLGPYGPILEAYPSGPEDAPTLRTKVIFARAGTYDVYLNIGDTAAADYQQNINEPNPLIFGFERGELKTYHPNDGVFMGTPGYNNYEIAIGQITVTAGEQRHFIIDDAPDYENGYRSVYLGMRFVLSETTGVGDWHLY